MKATRPPENVVAALLKPNPCSSSQSRFRSVTRSAYKTGNITCLNVLSDNISNEYGVVILL